MNAYSYPLLIYSSVAEESERASMSTPEIYCDMELKCDYMYFIIMKGVVSI